MSERTYQAGTIVKTGITFGSSLAIVMSYTQNESILWAIFHGILSWGYVIYRAIFQMIQ